MPVPPCALACQTELLGSSCILLKYRSQYSSLAIRMPVVPPSVILEASHECESLLRSFQPSALLAATFLAASSALHSGGAMHSLYR